MANKNKTENGLTFEQALERLEQIAAQLEGGKTSLEESLKLYEEGAALAAMCSGQLKNARQRIIELEPENHPDDADVEE